jgi:hypothetical protein
LQVKSKKLKIRRKKNPPKIKDLQISKILTRVGKKGGGVSCNVLPNPSRKRSCAGTSFIFNPFTQVDDTPEGAKKMMLFCMQYFQYKHTL